MKILPRSLFASGIALCAFTPAASPAITEYVRNGGFENVDVEPTTYDQITQAEGWSNVTIGYSELFSKSASAKTIGIPNNDYGHMDPLEGDHYAGFFAWKDDMRRNLEGDGDDEFVPGWNAYSEYLITDLLEPLVEGKEYEISYRVALSGNSDRAVGGLGAYCSENKLHYDHRKFIQENPQVSETPVLAEKGKWVEVKGTFEADGGEKYITIGAFPAAGFDTKKLIEGLDNKYAYYYIDNISLKPVTSK